MNQMMNQMNNNQGDEMYYNNCLLQIRYNSALWTDEDINWFKQYVIVYELNQGITQGQQQSVETQGQQQSMETQGQQGQSMETQGQQQTHEECHQDIAEWCNCDCRLCVAFADDDDHDDMWEAEQRRRARRQRNLTNKEKEDARDAAAFDVWQQYYQSADGIEQRRRVRRQLNLTNTEDDEEDEQIQGQQQQDYEDAQDATAFDEWQQYYQSADGMDDLQQSRLELDLENYRQSAIEDNRD
jgi:hypothetical protein